MTNDLEGFLVAHKKSLYNSGMKRLTLSLTFLLLASLACDLGSTAATPDVAAQQTQIAVSVAATLAAGSTPTSGSTEASPATVAPTQAQPISLPTALVPTTAPTDVPTARPQPTAFTPIASQGVMPNPVYSLQTELPFGDYVLRLWKDTATDSPIYDNIIVIAAEGEAPIQIENVSNLDQATGMDINGDGLPEVVIETFSGGAHCCFTNIIYTMEGTSMREILHSVESNCGGKLTDLNGDGVMEYDTCDDSFAYAYCPYVASPRVEVVYAYDATSGVYKPATPAFANLFTDQIAQDTQRAEQGKPGDDGEFDNSNKCSVLPVVLDYLYSGQTDKAWSEFNRLYTAADAATWRADIEKTVFASPRYVAP
jgi:hypothetical protein